MPREPKVEVLRFEGPNGMVAAATRLTGGKRTKKPKRAPAWYQQGWDYYDTIGEFRYAVSWVGNLLSRATLTIHRDGSPVDSNSDSDLAVQALRSLFGGTDGQREMLRQLGTHLTVPGDSYIVGEDMGDKPDRWQVVSATRIKQIGSEDSPIWKIGEKTLDNPLVIRIWRPHPDRQDQADSPTRAVLTVLAEIDGLSRYVHAQISSRLTGAGMVTIPNEITFTNARQAAVDGGETLVNSGGIDDLILEFIETAALAVADQADPSARIPLFIQGPGEHLDKIRHVTFWSELDEQAKELRDEAIRRLALGMDMPPEILTGSGELNHWNAWQVEEASIKAHTEPLLQLICNGLTDMFLRPYLEENGMSEEDARAYAIHADTSKIRLRPNRSKEAVELYQMGALSAAAMRRENGFDEEDAMTGEELVDFHVRKTAGGTVNPEIVAYALSLLGVPIPEEMVKVQDRMTEERPMPSLQEHPVNELPDESDIQASAAVVYRALERAGARIKSKYSASLVSGGERMPNESVYRFAEVTEDMIDDLLVGAWECTDTLGIRVSPVRLNEYARHLLSTNRVFSVESFRTWLATRP